MRINFKNYNKLSLVIMLGLLTRVIAIFYYADTKLDNEWGILLNNLYDHGILSYRSFNGNLISTAFMPPLYVYFLFAIKLVTPESVEFVTIVLLVQIILSTFSIFFFYKLSNFFFSSNWSIINSLLLSIFPLHIYAAIQISSITLQIFLLILYLYLFFLLYKPKKLNWFNILFFSLVSGLLMLLRGEFYLIFIVSLIYLFIFKKLSLKKIGFIFLISLLIISPYLIRNYFTFNKITLTKSSGYNLWKGNNPTSSVEGFSSLDPFTYNIKKKINNLPKDNLHDFYEDEIYLEEALNYIEDKPKVFIGRYAKKFLTFFYFNIKSTWPNYYHPLFIIPVVLVSIFSSVGILITLKGLSFEKGYLLLYLFLTIGIFSLFFILPRYKLMILPVQLIFMNHFLFESYKKICLLNKSFKDKKLFR